MNQYALRSLNALTGIEIEHLNVLRLKYQTYITHRCTFMFVWIISVDPHFRSSQVVEILAYLVDFLAGRRELTPSKQASMVLRKCSASYAMSLACNRNRHWPGVMPVLSLKNRQK